MAASFANPTQWILGFLLLFSAISMLTLRKPIHAALAFLVTLLSLATYYLLLSASFIAVMQIIVYAGAILVIFMFVIVLFQNAHNEIELYPPKSSPLLLGLGGLGFILAIAAYSFWSYTHAAFDVAAKKPEFGSVESLGYALYLDFVFPFEAVIVVFLVAIVGAFYIGRKED
jgi:NADH-quinone oxidoreductase subunit J